MDKLKTLFIMSLILLVLFLLLQLRLRIWAEFGGQRILVRVFFGPIRVTVYPRAEKPRKKKTGQPKERKPKPENEDDREGISLARFRELLDLALDSLEEVKNRLQIDELFLRLDWGLDDPADAAVSYGYANAVLAGLMALLEVNFKVKKQDAEIRLDYTLEKPKVYARCSCSLRLRQAISLGLGVGVQALRLYRSGRKQKEKTEQRELTKQ